MSNKAICPSSLEGIKRLAKSLKTERGIQHVHALDEAARHGGYQNFRHANNVLGAQGSRQLPWHLVFITVYWKDRDNGNKGRETLTIRLSLPWADLITPAQFENHRAFVNFRAEGPDHLARATLTSSQSQARRLACAAARTLHFMDATKLRPSKSYRRPYPGGRSTNAVPGHDHHSIWYDRESKRYLYADEPYERAADSNARERAEWARHHGYVIVKSEWPGMYNPDGGSRLYLISDQEKGIPLEPVVASLNKLPPPMVEGNWNGESAPTLPYFVSPGTIAEAEAEKEKSQTRPRIGGQRNTIGYVMTLVGPRRRPNARMPIETHTEIGALLKSVLAVTYYRKSAYNNVNAIRSDLDEWVQREYNTDELSDELFSNLYYRGEGGSTFSRSISSDECSRHEESLGRVKAALIKHYPDCPPLRSMLKKLDTATKSLRGWVF